MVGYAVFCINMAVIGFPVGGAKDIVDALINAATAVGETRAVAGGSVTVVEDGGDKMVGIGDGRTVEIATEQDGGTAVLLQCRNDEPHLAGTQLCVLGDLLHKGLLVQRVALAVNEVFQFSFLDG